MDADGSFVRRPLVTYSEDPGGAKFYVTNFESVRWNDELWLAFLDGSSKKAQPFRVVRVKPECTYQSMFDLMGGE